MRKLTPRQAIFVKEFLVDLNGTQAAIRAGYSPKAARQIADENLSKPAIQFAITEAQDARMARLDSDGDDIVRSWRELRKANPNAIMQHRRVCCRYCWGEGFGYQYRPSEFEKAGVAHERNRAEILAGGGADIGEFKGVPGDWYKSTIDPNPECPECDGLGIGEVFIQDTRKLAPDALRLFAGVKETKDGLEIKLHDQSKAAENEARHLGLFRDRVEVDVTADGTGIEELAAMYVERMAKARERQAAVLAERGITPDDED